MVSNQEVLTLALTVILLAHPSLTYGVIVHVRPTIPSTSCPTHPCYTLTEYAQHAGQLPNHHLVLQFLPGNHTLNVNLTITSIFQLEILGNASAVEPIRVACNSNVAFTFRYIFKVKIDGLAFVSCSRSHVV